jgi:hypothetical protein
MGAYIMKSYYSIMLFILFVCVMDIMAVVKTATLKQDISPADAAVVALTIIAVMLAYRLSQAEKRIAHLENRLEGKDSSYTRRKKRGSESEKGTCNVDAGTGKSDGVKTDQD